MNQNGSDSEVKTQILIRLPQILIRLPQNLRSE
jgi:hypothetical protein